MTPATTQPAARAVSAGGIVGRFTFTSNGSDGWEISSQVGQLLADVTREATTYIERLRSQPEAWGQVPEVEDRVRRFVWAGSPGSPWRYLMNTYGAGADDSNRPDNNFTDAIVVRRFVPEPPAGIGRRPSQLWDSSAWLSPYGAAEVAATSVARLPNPLEFPFEDADEPFISFARFSVANQTPTHLLNIAAVVRAIADAQPRWLAVSSAALGQRYLDAAVSLCPYDVAWETSFEIRSSAGSGRPLGLGIFGAEPEEPLPAGTIRLGEAPQAVRFRSAACPACSRPRPSWFDVVGTLVLSLATLATSEQAAGACLAEAEQLLALCAHLGQARVPASQFPTWFTAAELHPGDTAALVNRLRTLLPEVGLDHSGCEAPTTPPAPRAPTSQQYRIADHPVAGAQRANPPSPSPWAGVAGLQSAAPPEPAQAQPRPTAPETNSRAPGLPDPLREQVLDHLDTHRPDERTVVLARAVGSYAQLRESRVVWAHLAFSPATGTARVLDSFADLLAPGPLGMSSQLAAWCADAYLSRAVLNLCGFGAGHPAAANPQYLLGAGYLLDSHPEQACWPEALLMPVAGAMFVSRWLGDDPGSPLRAAVHPPGGQSSSLGQWLVDRAIEVAIRLGDDDRLRAISRLLEPMRDRPEAAAAHAQISRNLQSRRPT